MNQNQMPGNRRAPKYNPGTPVLEYVREPLYDRKQVGVAAAQQLTYFKTFLGGTLRDTNMTADGSIAAPGTFDVFGISFFAAQGTPVADLAQLYNSAYIEFFMSSKPYLQTMMFLIPSSGGLTGFASTTVAATTISQANNGVPSPMVYLPLDIEGEPLHIPSQQDFRAVITIQAPGVFSAIFDTWCVLHGIKGRPA